MKFILIIFSLLLAFSCTKKRVNNSGKKVLRVYTQDVQGFDPVYAANVSTAKEVAKVYEGLLEYHYLKRPYELQANLAEGMPEVSKDGLTFTFKIKKGVMFHDDPAFKEGKGRELVAKDFVYSLMRIADKKLGSSGWWLFDNRIEGLNEWREKGESNYDLPVSGLKALDSHTLQFKLTKVYPQFMYALAMCYSYAIPREAVEKYGKDFPMKAIGTGPFILKEYVVKSKFRYEKNPAYRDKFFPTEAAPHYAEFVKNYGGKKLPLVDEIDVQVILENQTQWLNFSAGKIDYLDIPKDNFDSSIIGNKLSDDLKAKGVHLEVAPSLSTYYVAFNQSHKVLNNVHLRRAISLSIDIDKFNKLFYNGTGLTAQSIIPPGLTGYKEDYKNPWKGKNLAKAKEELIKAGYPGGKGLPKLTLDALNKTHHRQQSEYIRKELEEAGIIVEVINSPFPEYKRRIQNREVMLLSYGWIGDYPDAENFFQLLYGPNKPPGTNYAGYNDSEFNKLYEKSTVMMPSKERALIYEKMNLMAADDLPWVYLIHLQEYFLYHDHLKNFLKSDFIYGFEQYLDVVR
ncbi:MAG: ABC-type transport system substrate-binding protein [Bacteriovoracaceae bacterium]|jgi:ABC-type transport system substrate-binding protein